MTVDILNQSRMRIPRAFLCDFLKVVDRQLKRRLPAVRFQQLLKKRLLIVFVDPAPMKALNFQFRGKNYATDVLSFAPIENDSLGELVMSPAVLKKQSLRTELNFREETAYMCLHGILHLLGYDHERSDLEAKKMFNLQNEVFAKIIGRPVTNEQVDQ